MYRMKTKHAHRPSRSRKRLPPAPRALPLSEVRSRLSPLVAEAGAPLGITVHGRVAAYLISADHLEALQRKATRTSRKEAHEALRGSVELVGDLRKNREAINRELEESLARTAAELLE